MTKKDIVKAISDQTGMPQVKTKAIVEKMFEAIVETLVQEGRIELRNFGVFEIRRRKARRARNPRTGHDVSVPEKWVVAFKPGKEMEVRVRQLAEQRRQVSAEHRAGNTDSGQSSTAEKLPPEAPTEGATDSLNAPQPPSGSGPLGAGGPSW